MPPIPALPNRRSVRLKNYDYTSPGVYFVTICTRNRVIYFDDQWLRELAASTWQTIPEHAPGVRLDAWVIMPNHIHGLLVFEPVAPGPSRVGSAPSASGQKPTTARISPQHRSLAVVVRAYKAAVTGACRKAGRAFAWQDGYYEHVIRDADELGRVRQYIADNPMKWELDSEHPNNT